MCQQQSLKSAQRHKRDPEADRLPGGVKRSETAVSEEVVQVTGTTWNHRSQRLLRNRLPLLQSLVGVFRISLRELRLVPPHGLEPRTY